VHVAELARLANIYPASASRVNESVGKPKGTFHLT